MEFALQALVVAVLVIGSAVFAAWRLSPARLKLRLLDALKPDTAHLWGRWAARLRNGVAEELIHGCSACSRTPSPSTSLKPASPPLRGSAAAGGK